MTARAARLAAIVTIAVVVALRLAVLDVPLERDEGEFAYMGQLILAGETPYLAAANMKLPGAYYAYAGILAVLGDTPEAVRLGLVAVNLLAIWLVYRLGVLLLDVEAGAAAASAYAVLSLDPSVLGFTAKAEHFVVPCVLGGLLVLLRARGPQGAVPLAAAGLLLGLGVLMKQHAATFVAFAIAWTVAAERSSTGGSWSRALGAGLVVAAGACIPFALTCAALAGAGAFAPFWFWTVAYAREYAGLVPLRLGLAELARHVREIGAASPALWVLAAVGASTPAWDPRARRALPFLSGLGLASLAAIVPGLRFSEHYFLLVLPVASLLVGAAVSAATRLVLPRRPAVAALVAGGVPLAAAVASLLPDPALLFLRPPAAVSRSIYGDNPFPESVEIARYLAAHTTPDERIAVIGSEPQIYFLAHRRAAVTFMYVYPLMEAQSYAARMQRDMIAELAAARPRYLVLVNVPTSWSLRPDSAHTLLDWVERTVNTDYRMVGLVDILPNGETVARWDAAAAGAQPASLHHVAIFERIA